MFDRDALGLDLVIHPSAEAERYGWSEAFGSDPLVYLIGCSGRGREDLGPRNLPHPADGPRDPADFA
jgi:hypothetical protein